MLGERAGDEDSDPDCDVTGITVAGFVGVEVVLAGEFSWLFGCDKVL